MQDSKDSSSDSYSNSLKELQQAEQKSVKKVEQAKRTSEKIVEAARKQRAELLEQAKAKAIELRDGLFEAEAGKIEQQAKKIIGDARADAVLISGNDFKCREAAKELMKILVD